MSCKSCTRPDNLGNQPKPSSENNKFTQCPPRMEDGRNFTDYRPKCFQQYMVGDKLMSSFEQRMYLTKNAEDLMKTHASKAYVANRCGPCEEPFDVGTMLPEAIQQSCDDKTCTFNASNPYGLGLGRQFILSDEEHQFRSRFLKEKEKEQDMFKSHNINPREVDPMYYPIDGMAPTNYDRFAIPSGALPLRPTQNI
jgi:hypothetical protein